MFLIRGTREIDEKRNSDIYILKKDGDIIALQEDDNGDTEIDVSSLFSNAVKWKWGIKSRQYYGVFVVAIRVKQPKLVLNVENILIHITKSSIVGLVFHKDEKTALEMAHRFKKDNREYIAFEVSPTYEKRPIGDIDSRAILTSIEAKLEKIERNTEIISESVSEVGTQIEEIKEMVKDIRDQIKREKETVEVHIVNTEGVFSLGKKLGLKVLGDVFDYIMPDIESFKVHFKVVLSEEAEKQVIDRIVKLYEKGEKFVKANDISDIVKPKTDKEWEIAFKVKDDKLKRTALLMQKLIKGIDIHTLEHSLLSAIQECVDNGIELSLDVYIKHAPPQMQGILERMRKLLGYEKRIGDSVVVNVPNEFRDIFINALSLEIERQNKRMEIRL